MRKAIQGIIFLKNMATGILAPVLTLTLLQHGADIRTVSLFIGLYSATIIIAEFPSGVFADLYGRKTSFLLSCALYVVSYSVLLVSSRRCAARRLHRHQRAGSRVFLRQY